MATMVEGNTPSLKSDYIKNVGLGERLVIDVNDLFVRRCLELSKVSGRQVEDIIKELMERGLLLEQVEILGDVQEATLEFTENRLRINTISTKTEKNLKLKPSRIAP